MPLRSIPFIGLLLAAGLASAQAPAPIAPGPATDTFFGTAVPDPYRALERVQDPAVQAWMGAESERAAAVLARIPGREAVRAALERYESASPAVVKDVQRTEGGHFYFERRGAGDNQFKLYVRDAAGTERLLVDPMAGVPAGGAPRALAYYRPSPDNRWLAYALQEGGSEAAVLRVLDLRTGAERIAPLTRVDYGGIHWLDADRFSVNRLQPLRAGMPATEKYRRSTVLRVDAARGRVEARPLFGRGTPGVALQPDHAAWVARSPDGQHLVATVFNGVQKEVAVWVAPAARAATARPGWRRVVDFGDQVSAVALQGGGLYALSHRGAPRSQLLHIADLATGDIAGAATVLPQGDNVLLGMATPSDALYVAVRDGNAKRLLRRAYGAPSGAPFTEVVLPVRGDFALQGSEAPDTAYEPRLPGLVLANGGWTRAKQVVEVRADGSVVDTGLQPVGPYDRPDDLVATEVEVPTADGVRVPMSVIHRKGVKLDGGNPTLLTGYASYGMTQEPGFSPGWLAWFDQGGVVAVANPRGSGVRGEDWYTGGKLANKPNTWRDFIACAEWLVANGYTRPARLGIQGGSAGGILVGRAMTERPDLFAAAVPMVGALDMVRFEASANGASNVPEFGSVQTEAGFRSLLAMSTYHQVRPNTAYPAVLLTHGVNDPRVDVWNSTKTAARLQAASTSGKPVLLRLDWQAGHGVGATRAQRQAERADIYAFLLWQFGMPGFQPAP